MAEKYTKGEMHGCIVCGRLYEMYVVYDAQGRFMDAKVMSQGGKLVDHSHRPLVACNSHSQEQIEAAVVKVYGQQKEDD
ncbi:MAG: hypothetical protein AB1649_22680 [Chloroflexota bacterium]